MEGVFQIEHGSFHRTQRLFNLRIAGYEGRKGGAGQCPPWIEVPPQGSWSGSASIRPWKPRPARCARTDRTSEPSARESTAAGARAYARRMSSPRFGSAEMPRSGAAILAAPRRTDSTTSRRPRIDGRNSDASTYATKASTSPDGLRATQHASVGSDNRARRPSRSSAGARV